MNRLTLNFGLWLILAFWLPGLPSASAEGFVSVIEDVPIMEGLAEDPARAVVFDAPTGRIAEATLTGPFAEAEVLKFYGETLPELGWLPDGEAAFRREGEALTFSFSQEGSSEGDLLIIGLALRPL
ncbi:MAG: hypothetical protein ACPGOV_02260 [Magnetovibrionaceae bacterium]